MSENNNNNVLAAAADDFFIPDLCSPRPLLALVIVAELMAILWVMASLSSLSEFTWSTLALASLMTQIIMLSSAFMLCTLRGPLMKLPRSTAAVASFTLILGIITFFSWIAEELMRFLYIRNVLSGFSWDIVIRNVIMGAIVAGLMLRYFYLQEQLRSKQRAELTSRLQALQSRIRPHFLFNSMNIIASLIHVDPDKAEQVVEDLSELFRASLKAEGEVPLNDELMLCQHYVNIEKSRLGERLQMRWQIVEFPDAVRIPSLTLQPLIENAIYHGVEPRFEPSVVNINVNFNGKEVTVVMTNPVGKAVHARGNKMAIANIRQRLNALYGEKAILRTSADNEIFTTYLSYPLRLDTKK